MQKNKIGCGRRRLWGAVALLSLAIGCQTSPARPGGCSAKGCSSGRSRVLARQLLGDTTEEIVHQPLRAGRTVLADEASWFASAGRGLFGKRLAMRLHGAPPPLCCSPALLAPALVETNLQPAAMHLHREGDEALAVLEQMIDAASCRIDVMIYTWEDDPVGWSVAHHLAARASPQCRVRLLVDGGANLIFAPPPGTPPGESSSGTPQSERGSAADANRVVCWLAAQPHVELIRIRNPFVHFDHRKLVLVDGQAAWAGGRNFTYASFFGRHDMTYTLRGPLVTQMQAWFETYWRDQGGAGADVRTDLPPFTANAAGRLVQNAPTEHSLRHALYHAIDHARGFVWLENPYLCDNGVLTKMARARRRGVDARVVFTIQSDTDSINHVNRVTANRLLAAGVRVYLYPGRVHTKCALVDDVWAYLGSGNFDLLSLHRNHEIGVVLGPGPVVLELHEILFQADFNPDWESHAPLPVTAKDYGYEMLSAFFF